MKGFCKLSTIVFAVQIITGLNEGGIALVKRFCSREVNSYGPVPNLLHLIKTDTRNLAAVERAALRGKISCLVENVCVDMHATMVLCAAVEVFMVVPIRRRRKAGR